MVNRRCEICKNNNLIQSKIIQDLYYCIQCDNFFYYGDNITYPIQQVLRAIGKVFPDLILNTKSLGILADMCIIKDNFLEIYANIILSDIININSLKQDIQEESADSIIISYSNILEQSFKIDYNYCEYIIKIILFALGLDLNIEEPSLDDKSSDSNIIKSFKQSTDKILRGNSVEFSWDIRIKHSIIKLQIGDKTYSIKNPRYSKRIQITENTIVTLIVENRKNHQELARKRLNVIVVDPVEILEFTASRNISIESEPIYLRWKIKNAEKVFILPTKQEITKESTITVHPIVSTTYTIKATNSCSSAERSCSISVKKIPSISNVIIPTPSIYKEIRISIRMPEIPFIRLPINYSISHIRPITTIPYILPFPNVKKKKIGIKLKYRWFEIFKSLFYYFENYYRKHE